MNDFLTASSLKLSLLVFPPMFAKTSYHKSTRCTTFHKKNTFAAHIPIDHKHHWLFLVIPYHFIISWTEGLLACSIKRGSGALGPAGSCVQVISDHWAALHGAAITRPNFRTRAVFNLSEFYPRSGEEVF